MNKRTQLDLIELLIALGAFIFFGILWIVSAICSLAVPALAIWALGHYALGWW